MFKWRFSVSLTLGLRAARVAFAMGAMVLFPTSRAWAAGDTLRAGAAKVEITPATVEGMDPPTGRFEHEHLYVRAIVLDNGASRAALLGADQGGLSEGIYAEAAKRIAKELSCPEAAVLMSATHTHSSGANFGQGPSTGALSVAEQAMVDAMMQAVQHAKANLQPARMAFGKGDVFLNVNRDAIDPRTHRWTQAPNLQAASDKTVAVLAFENFAGEPLGVYVNYAMHPINGYLANFVSADFAGAMSRYIEETYGDKAIAIFSQGTSGDQNPLYMRPSTNGLASRSRVPITGNELVRESVEAPLRDGGVKGQAMDAKTREGLERWMESEGDVLGEEVIRIITNAMATEGNVRIAGSQAMVTCPGRTRTDQGREGMVGAYVDGPAVPIRLGVLGIGDVVLTSIDAEVYTPIGQRVKRQSPMANTVVVTLANGRSTSGYIPDDASFGHSTFQVLNSHLKVGCADDAIANGLTTLVNGYVHQKP